MKPRKEIEKFIREFVDTVETTKSSRVLVDMVVDFIVDRNLENRSPIEDLIKYIYVNQYGE